MILHSCPFCEIEVADDVDFAYHLIDKHTEEVLNNGSTGLSQTIVDTVYLLIEADEADLIGFVRE
jgi:hypothetical protein